MHEYYSAERQEIAHRQYSEAQTRIENCRETPDLFAAFECVEEAVAAEREEYTSYKDLQAQQHMSVWALGVLCVSLITLIITTVGVVFVYGTLRETSAGVVAMRREQRPWLSLRDVVISLYLVDEESARDEGVCKVWLSIRYCIVNSGSSPAAIGRIGEVVYDISQEGPVKNRELKGEKNLGTLFLKHAPATEGEMVIAPNSETFEHRTKIVLVPMSGGNIVMNGFAQIALTYSGESIRNEACTYQLFMFGREQSVDSTTVSSIDVRRAVADPAAEPIRVIKMAGMMT